MNKFCAVNSDDAVDPTVTTVYEGKVIGFCCEDCQKKVDLDPTAYAAKLKEQAVVQPNKTGDPAASRVSCVGGGPYLVPQRIIA